MRKIQVILKLKIKIQNSTAFSLNMKLRVFLVICPAKGASLKLIASTRA